MQLAFPRPPPVLPASLRASRFAYDLARSLIGKSVGEFVGGSLVVNRRLS